MTQDVNIIKARKDLQHKAGRGPLDKKIVEKSQRVMDHQTQDFSPIAVVLLDLLDGAIIKVKKNPAMPNAKELMTKPVMELKANAKMFKYDLVTTLANIMLGFLETIDDLDETAIEIVAAHQKTLSLIVQKKMRGDGGSTGQLLEKELREAIGRYFSKG